MAYVYKITNPKGRIYVGSTLNIKRRFRSYKTLKCDGQRKLYNSLIKHGVDNHIFEIICECEEKEMRKLERYYGLKLDVLSKKGLNCILPEDGEEIRLFSDETRKLMSERQIGRKASDITKERMSIARKGQPGTMNGKKHTQETRNKMSVIQGENKYNKGGYKLSDEFCQNTSERMIGNSYSLGFKHSKETCMQRSEISKNGDHTGLALRDKPTIDLETGIVFDSLKIAYESLPSLNRRWKLKYLHNMLGGYKRNQTSLMYA